MYPDGVWSRESPTWRLRKIIRFYEHIDRHLRFRYDTFIRQRLGDSQTDLAWEYVKSDQPAGACRSTLSACRYYVVAAAGTAQPFWLRLTALGVRSAVSALRSAAAWARRGRRGWGRGRLLKRPTKPI